LALRVTDFFRVGTIEAPRTRVTRRWKSRSKSATPQHGPPWSLDLTGL